MEFSESLQLDRMAHWPRFLRHPVGYTNFYNSTITDVHTEIVVRRCRGWSRTCPTPCELRLCLLTDDLETSLRRSTSAALIKVLRTSVANYQLRSAPRLLAIVIEIETKQFR